MTISQSQNRKGNYSCNYPVTPLLFTLFNKNKTNVCEIKLDRITITGFIDISVYDNTLKENHWVQSGKNLVDSKPNKYNLFRDRTSIATLSKNKYSNSWRIDTSNHLTEQEKQYVTTVTSLFKNPRITRLDIAVDFINFDDSGMIYKLYKPNTSTSYFYGRTGKLETAYAGKSKSIQVYRYYDKIVELKRHRIKIPRYIKTWERLELQLRQSKIKNPVQDWEKRTRNMINCLFLPHVTKQTIAKTTERAMINELLRNPESFTELSSRTRAKYRRKIRKLHKKSTPFRIKLANEVLLKNRNDIQKEINSFL